MDIVFLKNGQKAKLIKKYEDDAYLVEPIFLFYDWDGASYEDYGEKTIVDKILRQPPKERFSDEIEEKKKELELINSNLEKKKNELANVKSEVNAISRRKIDLEKLIIDRSIFLNAKRITIFKSGNFFPTDVTCKGRDFKISSTIHFNSNKEERHWVYTWFFDSWDYGNSIDNNYILFDKTDEEIIQISKERIRELTRGKEQYKYANSLKNCDNKYIPEELLEFKKELVNSERNERKKQKEKKIEELKKQIENLEKK